MLGELPADYRLFLNPLILTEDGRDDYLCAEHYCMFGNFDKDPDRFPSLRQFALNFLRELGYGESADDQHGTTAIWSRRSMFPKTPLLWSAPAMAKT